MREKLRSTRIRESDHAQCNATINSLQSEISKLSHQLSEATMQGSKSKRILELEIDRLSRQQKDGSINKSSDIRALET